ncbi:hypothetical protein [Actinomadura chibensis]|uniref:Uncharacterized protein n=1 Tax=Actinomadura chibensis TaxID=392828 RepID=A0A5D0NWE6_9ACTN|nr:hypothetical protein [Actinomadura chibensis]TYB48549.1 hypothetical protein FXF69_05005 [Actinomadura chibensis]
MRFPWPVEMQYFVSMLSDRWRRLREAEPDRGVETLEVIIWAAVLTVAAVAAGALVVSKINNRASQIK